MHQSAHGSVDAFFSIWYYSASHPPSVTRQLAGAEASIMVKLGLIEKEGMVRESLPNAMFRVTMPDGPEVLAQISGRLRKFKIKILVGDRVRIEMSNYDLTRGRITYRFG